MSVAWWLRGDEGTCRPWIKVVDDRIEIVSEGEWVLFAGGRVF